MTFPLPGTCWWNWELAEFFSSAWAELGLSSPLLRTRQKSAAVSENLRISEEAFSKIPELIRAWSLEMPQRTSQLKTS